MDQNKPRASLGQRWSEAQPSKTAVFWACVASVVATLIVGFSWGGWVTGGTAQTMAEAATMPGETEPDSEVADECANLLMQMG